jgi:hypothetical protein
MLRMECDDQIGSSNTFVTNGFVTHDTQMLENALNLVQMHEGSQRSEPPRASMGTKIIQLG